MLNNKCISSHSTFFNWLVCRKWLLFVMLVATATVSGCAYRNEGAIDFRKAEIATGRGSNTIGTGFTARAQAQPLISPEIKLPSHNAQGEPARLVPLVRKDVSSSDPSATLTEMDSVSIRLRSAFIGYYSEGIFSYAGDLLFDGQVEGGGEIAVLADVFPLGSAEGKFDFSDKGIEKGRVVYFSRDVQEGQYLNFANMPVYGPVTYANTPIAIALTVMELDITDKLTADLLARLASLGATSFPSLAPQLNTLNSLGETLVQQQTNDINARYFMVLDPNVGRHPDLASATLEVGNYVFIRSENRMADVNWENLLLDENTGHLYVKNYQPTPEVSKRITKIPGIEGSDESGKFVAEPYKENNYFTFQVNKNEKAISIDLAEYDFGTLLTQLNEDLSGKEKIIDAIEDSLAGLAVGRGQIALFDQIRSDLGELEKAKNNFDELTNVVNNGDASKKQAQLEASGVVLRQFTKIWTAFAPSLAKADGADDKAETKTDDVASQAKKLTASQRDYVLTKLSNIAAVKDAGQLLLFQAEQDIPDRRKEICKLLLPGPDFGDKVCG